MEINNTLLNQYGEIAGANINTFLLNGLVTLAIIVLGVIIGKFIKFSLKKLSGKLNLDKKIRPSFIILFLLIVEISIYIVFANFAIRRLQISMLTTFVDNVLIVIPAFTTSLVLISIGFALAVYLRDVIEESGISGWKTLSLIIFYFTLFIFGIYSVRIALIPFDQKTVTTLIIILTSILASVIAYILARKELKEDRQ